MPHPFAVGCTPIRSEQYSRMSRKGSSGSLRRTASIVTLSAVYRLLPFYFQGALLGHNLNAHCYRWPWALKRGSAFQRFCGHPRQPCAPDAQHPDGPRRFRRAPLGGTPHNRRGPSGGTSRGIVMDPGRSSWKPPGAARSRALLGDAPGRRQEHTESRTREP